MDGKIKFRTRRSSPYETSDDVSSSSSSSSISPSWSVADDEVYVDAFSVGSCVDDMAVKCRVDHLRWHCLPLSTLHLR